VTIIFRTAPNPKAFGNSDINGKAGARRKSEFQHIQSHMHDKVEHGDKTDHTGILSNLFSSKYEITKSPYLSVERSL
jgi:hypothetical protein